MAARGWVRTGPRATHRPTSPRALGRGRLLLLEARVCQVRDEAVESWQCRPNGRLLGRGEVPQRIADALLVGSLPLGELSASFMGEFDHGNASILGVGTSSHEPRLGRSTDLSRSRPRAERRAQRPLVAVENHLGGGSRNGVHQNRCQQVGRGGFVPTGVDHREHHWLRRRIQAKGGAHACGHLRGVSLEVCLWRDDEQPHARHLEAAQPEQEA